MAAPGCPQRKDLEELWERRKQEERKQLEEEQEEEQELEERK